MTDNQSPEALPPEDAEQREQWEEIVKTHGGNRLAAMSFALAIYGGQQPKQGSFSKHLICMSNDCVALADTEKENELLRRELDHATNGKWSEMEIELINLRAKSLAAALSAARAQFPITGGVTVDWQLVADHGQQARRNHGGQSVKRLAERGGLDWCELHAILHGRHWKKMDTTQAAAECRAIEARYLAALQSGQPEPQGDDETYEVGKRDGYEQAVQDIDQMTGGDGEYRYCTDHDPERHCPDAATMKQKIAERITAERARTDKLPRLDDGLITAALEGHYGKEGTAIGAEGVDLTARDTNWTFRQGFTRMWAGVRKEIKRREAQGQSTEAEEQKRHDRH